VVLLNKSAHLKQKAGACSGFLLEVS